MTTNSGPSSNSNPRKFAEKIALLKAKEAESTAQFDHVMRDVHGSVPTNHNQIPNPGSHCMDPRYAQQQEQLTYTGSLSTSAIPNANSGGMVAASSGNQMAPINHGVFGNFAPKGNSSSCIPSSISSGHAAAMPMRPIWEGTPPQNSAAAAGMLPSSASTSMGSGTGLLPSDSPKIYASNSLPNFPMAMMSGSQGNNMMPQQQYSQSPPLSITQQQRQTASTQHQQQPQQQYQMQSISRGNHPQNLNFRQQSQHQHSSNSGVDLQGALHSLENIKTGGRQYVMDQLNKRIMKHMSNSNTMAALGGSRNTGVSGSGGGGGSPHHHHHHHNHHHHSHHHHLVSHTVPVGTQPPHAPQRQRNNASSGSSTIGSPTSTGNRLSGPPCVGLPTPPPGGYTAALLGSDTAPPAPAPPPYHLETPQFTGVISDNWRRTASDSAIHTSVLQQQQQQQQAEHHPQVHQQFYQSAHPQQAPSYLEQQPQHQAPLLLPTLLGSSSNPMQIGDEMSSFQSASSGSEQQAGVPVKRCPSGPVYSTGDNGVGDAGLGPHASTASSMNPSLNVTMVGSLPDLSASNVPHHTLASSYSNSSQYPPPPVSSFAGPNSVPASVTFCQTSNPTSPSSDAGVSLPPTTSTRDGHDQPPQQQSVYPGHPGSPHTAMHLTQQQFERFNMNECDSPPILPVSMAVDSSAAVQGLPPQSHTHDLASVPQERMQQLSAFGPEAMIEMSGAGRIPDIILTEPEVERRDSFNLTREVLSSLGCTSDSLDNMMDFALPQTDVDQLLDVDDSDLELLNDTAGLVHYVADPAIEEQLRKEHKQLHQL